MANSSDKLYADWCLQNNWMKLDLNAFFYVCGEDAYDEEYKEWVENKLFGN